jgi:hypothetical protein
LSETASDQATGFNGQERMVAAAIMLFALYCCIGIFVENCPQGDFRRGTATYFSIIAPFISQHWAMFAPDPPMSDIHVLVRASGAGVTTSWLDVYSVLSVRREPFRATNALSEAMTHASRLRAKRGRIASFEVAVRLAGMILAMHFRARTFAQMQLEVERRPLQRIGDGDPPARFRRHTTPWVSFPQFDSSDLDEFAAMTSLR